eukprot:CAMPEP_0174332666 /NCGR_PEP_ID=MMETSP0810-20121108/18489_1 /TAXON_ID=73025 ORGANISM="Eutreptiella gymnastica-like, Strain CCMP1594" /NCGR_SAMPLE_ID=MMETSP0810 /ASSEMBLY_ACC=CAM_ASM_000659 /LENGTH=67 /DNA_ID=CAMNT_0015449229 /DNA_START=72 /DNA_END=271 /DNA_ORIENTATION=-
MKSGWFADETGLCCGWVSGCGGHHLRERRPAGLQAPKYEVMWGSGEPNRDGVHEGEGEAFNGLCFPT